MRATAWRAAWLVAIGLLGSQSGHLLVYQLRFGARAVQVESTGGHAYFPALMSGALALAGLTAIASLGLVGAARLRGGRRSGRPIVRAPVIDLLAVLFTLQLAAFGLQEAIESAAAGAGLEPVVLVYGIACQLLVALLGAIALSLFLARLEEAVERLREPAARSWPGPQPVAEHRRRLPQPPRLAPQHLLAGWGSRGPPPASR